MEKNKKMIEKKTYLDVLACIEGKGFLVNVDEIFTCKDYSVIGDKIIEKLLQEFAEVDSNMIKQIICMYMKYNQQEYEKLEYNELCIAICEKVIRFKSFPFDEIQNLNQQFENTKNKYNGLTCELEQKILELDNEIKRNDDTNSEDGELIQEQKRVIERNASNKSLIKDLKALENTYIELEDQIQEKYVYKEMLTYVKNNMEEYFKDTLIVSESVVDIKMREMAIEMAKEDNSIRDMYNVFLEYNRYLEAANNVIASLYKPFFLIKMRKFYEDIEEFYSNNYNGAYYKKEEELLAICKERADAVKSSDEWIYLRNNDKVQYLSELHNYVDSYKVMDYLKDKIGALFCLQNRKDILQSAIQLFNEQKYLLFVNIVVIQIEGIIYDLFFDANIQKRLDGKFDLYMKDDLKGKLSKNNEMNDIAETNLYFRFYFNNSNFAHRF